MPAARPHVRQASAGNFIATILDFFRLEYAIHSENYLTQARIKENEKRFREMLRPPWTLDRDEELREPYVIRLDPLQQVGQAVSKSMGPASALGKYIKHYVPSSTTARSTSRRTTTALSSSS